MTALLDTRAVTSLRQRYSQLAAIVVLSAITPALLMTAPAVATQLASQWGLGPAQIGNLFMVELGAMSLATLPGFYWLKRVNLRRAAVVAGLVFIAGNALSALATTYPWLMALRFATALGGGSLMIICMSSAAALPNASRVYGLWVLGQLVLGALGLQVLPLLFTQLGLAACYASLATLMILALPLALAFPASLPRPDHQHAETLHKGKALLGLAAVFCFYLSLSGAWTFMGAIAAAAAISAPDSGQVLAVATLLGIAGAASASLLGARAAKRLPLLLGYGAMAAAVLLLDGRPTLMRFAAAALLFKFTWTFVLPIVLASIARIDPSGRLMNATNLVIGGGLALGPALAGHLIESSGDYQITLVGAAALCLLSLLLVLASRAPTQA